MTNSLQWCGILGIVFLLVDMKRNLMNELKEGIDALNQLFKKEQEEVKNPHDGSTLNDFLLEEDMQKQEAKKEKKQYERYVVQFYNNYKYSLKWVDQTICLSLEEAKSFVDIYKKQTYTTCDKVRIVHRIVQEEILEEGALNMVEQSI